MMLSFRRKEADLPLHKNLETAKSYLKQYQILEQRIKGLKLAEQTDYIQREIETARAIQCEIEETLRQMPITQKKTVIELHYISGMTFDKIGTKLLIAPATVLKYHKLGLERVYEILMEEAQ